ncbi:hypothetical protein Taro_001807 [Colocasia esculenta]|uniref:Uncharacterized protein n=1 Tax=Colocasia esculenta TaxID=4460 RepID=A0A843TC89_COLES|nr:hypothetical protein [Colocasia esculenta]
MVRGAQSGSNSERRMSSGRSFSAASASGHSSVPPPLAADMFGPVYTPSSYNSRYLLLLLLCLLLWQQSNHRFTRPLDEARSRSVWTTTARSNYKHLLYNARKNAQRVCQSADPTLWRERALTWMRKDYWEGLCNIWAAERWQETSTTMKVNRAANPEANKHTSGSVSFATHQSRLEKELKRPLTFQEVFDKTHKKKGMDLYISDRAREVAESYSQQMTEKYTGGRGAAAVRSQGMGCDIWFPKERPCVWFWAQYGQEQGVIWRLEFSLTSN